MNLKFPYHEGVIFSALTQEMVFSPENRKQSRVRPTCQGKCSLATPKVKQTSITVDGTGALASVTHTPSQRQFQPVTPNTSNAATYIVTISIFFSLEGPVSVLSREVILS